MAKNTDLREASTVLAIGTGRTWQCVTNLLRMVKGGKAWCKRDGTPLGTDSLRVMFNRTLDTLQKSGVVEIKIERGIRDHSTRFVRVKSEVLENFARSADGIDPTRTKIGGLLATLIESQGPPIKNRPPNDQKGAVRSTPSAPTSNGRGTVH